MNNTVNNTAYRKYDVDERKFKPSVGNGENDFTNGPSDQEFDAVLEQSIYNKNQITSLKGRVTTLERKPEIPEFPDVAGAYQLTLDSEGNYSWEPVVDAMRVDTTYDEVAEADVFNKTWQEVKDAFDAGAVIAVNNGMSTAFVQDCFIDDSEEVAVYVVNLGQGNYADCEASDGYPAVNTQK